MKARAGLRGRLVVLVIAVVGVTAVLVGAISVYLVDRSLRSQLAQDAAASVEFNLAVLAPAAGVPSNSDRSVVASSGVLERFLSRGVDGVWVEFPDDALLSGPVGLGPLPVSDELRTLVTEGQIAYEFTDTPQGTVLISAGRLPPAGPDFFFVTSATIVDETVRRLVLTVTGVGLGVLLVGVVVAAGLARRILRPVAAAQRGAERLAGGDLNVRIPEEGSDEFGRLSSAFNTMAASLQDTIEALSEAQARERRFAADVSHELRTPLTGLVNEAAMLHQRLTTHEMVNEDDRIIAAMLNNDVGRLHHLVEELLEISRLDSGAHPPTSSLVDMNAFLAALIAERHSDAQLSSNLGQPVYTDPHGIERIVGNLLDNARVHAPGRATNVTVSKTGTDTKPEMLRIVVSDQGPGVEEADLTSLFDRFTTGNPARSTGSGLGLAIAAQHTQRLGGEISAANQPGGGLAVTVLLPVGELLHGRE